MIHDLNAVIDEYNAAAKNRTAAKAKATKARKAYLSSHAADYKAHAGIDSNETRRLYEAMKAAELCAEEADLHLRAIVDAAPEYKPDLTIYAYEFKLKRPTAREAWEEIRVYKTIPLTPDDAEAHAEYLSDKFLEEVRYNRTGCAQGHYVTSKRTLKAYFNR